MKTIEQKIDESPELDLGAVLNRSFNLFKEVWLDGLIHVLLTMGVVFPLVVVSYLPLLIAVGVENITSANAMHSVDNTISGLGLVWLIGGGVLYLLIIMLVQGVAMGILAHFYTVLKQKDLNDDSDKVGYFYFFKKEHLLKLLYLSFATFAISLVAMALCVLPIFYVMVPLQLFVLVFAFNPSLSSSDIVKISFKLGHKYWLMIFALIFIGSLIAQLGVILCFVGLFATAFFSYIPLYYVYKDVIGFSSEF